MSERSWEPADSGYRIERRRKKKRGGGELSGYALDITVRVNAGGAYFVEDHNGAPGAFPLNNRDECIKMIVKEFERNHREHFGRL